MFKRCLALLLAILMLGSTVAFAEDTCEPSSEPQCESAAEPVASATETAVTETVTPASTETAAEPEQAAQECTTTEEPAVTEIQVQDDSQVIVTEINSAQDETPAGSGGADGGNAAEQSGNKAQITSVSFDIVNTVGSEVNCSIRFAFDDTSSDKSYECFITALQIQSDGQSTANDKANALLNDITQNPSGPNAQSILAKAQKIAENFLTGEGFILTKGSSKDTPGELSVFDDLIDAEKYDNEYNPAAGTEDPYGDSQLCWAASASDVLTYTGWSVNSNEDTTFSQFTNAFYNNGGMTVYGVKWYLDGVDQAQTNPDANGDIVHPEHSYYAKDIAMERETYTEDDVTISGTPYSADSLTSLYMVYAGTSIDTVADNTIDALNAGDGVGVSYGHEYNGVRNGGHAITAFGYIKELFKSGIEALKALFISDSDTDCGAVGDAKEKASETINNRESDVNKYTMYYVEPTVSVEGYDTARIYTSTEEKAKEDSLAAPYKAALETITTVISTKNAESQDIPYETSDKHDSRTEPDIVPSELKISTEEVNAGESVTVEATFINSSYVAAAAAGESDVLINYNILVFDENKNFICCVPYQGTVPRFDAMKTLTFSSSQPMNTPGTYYLSLEVDSIGYYDDNGEWQGIKEAYASNNSLTKSMLKIIIKGNDNNAPAVAVSIPTYTAHYALSSEEPLSVSFSLDPELGKVLGLTDPKGGTVAEGSYTITDNGDGTYTVTFSAEYLKTLSVGRHKLTLETENGKIYFIITIA